MEHQAKLQCHLHYRPTDDPCDYWGGQNAHNPMANLVVNVRVSLPPAEIVPQNSVSGVANSSAIKDWQVIELLLWKEGLPAVDIVSGEAAGNQGDQLAAPPTWLKHHHVSISCQKNLIT